MSPNMHVANDATYENEVARSTGLSILDFWAEWCTSCKQLGKTLDGVADEFAGRVKIYKVNAEESPQTALKFRVRGLPSMVFLKNGQLVDQVAGNPSKTAIVEMIQKHL